ncbi:MAG TPA: HNH endonuclease [Pirellulales bacterium]|nr:HNH endonuclease [Pirellulales bacterium]
MPAAPEPTAFRYPTQRLERRHGPCGYADYVAFRPWLRDEFSFRCVYCLIREQWGSVTAEFDLDHFVPQQLDPEKVDEYENLLYACRACNLRKGSRVVPDPTAALTAANVRVYPDGTLVGVAADADKIIRLLCLNSRGWRRWRRTWIRIVELASEHDHALHRELMGYPQDLPDLSACRAPENTRPEGSDESHFAHRQRGHLPEILLS